ncbi:DHA2 family efflux MFS transporter permease subunit [Psychrobacter sanguinis]|uniref:DHA2 family efflux MFS transporter permease subunit n=1 Tax=Psychrobacter sanguinis TaxID=861445 RepID=UPI0019196C57|nr:DHA2 family efflux MFS transporter permease subunit [Psychrobacter sanguinis]MCC3307796.1 DHA2 family efflux MFS transporter permease subunit [Psychrobacter sanguinis]UEC25093.1 DHA2 family efflux MFS transporter permease subunit [Psychrobacter sanguinis]
MPNNLPNAEDTSVSKSSSAVLDTEPKFKLSPSQAKFLPYVLAVALFMQILDATILNTALPEMALALGESPLKMQWAVISYALTLAIFIPISGFMADKYGTRKVFLSAIVLFSIGSIFCAMSPSLDILVASRILQGIGGAMMTPVARLILVKSYPRNQLLTVMNFAVIPALIAPLVGPLVGGYLVQYASWHWIFLINVPMGILGMIIGFKLVPDLREATGKLDWLGFGLFAIAAGLLTLAVELLSKPDKALWGVSLVAIGISLLLMYARHARKATNPIFPLSLFDIRTFRIGITGNLFTRLGISAVPYLMPLLLQVAFKYTPSQAGWLLTPIAVGAMGIKPWVSKIIQRFSYRKVLVINTTVLGTLIILLAQLDASMPWYYIAPLLVVMGACNSMQFSAMNTITIGDLKGSQTSSGNSLMAVNQQLAVSFGIAFGAAILTVFNDRLNFEIISAFHATYYVLGVITIISGLSFLRLKPEDGRGLY